MIDASRLQVLDIGHSNSVSVCTEDAFPLPSCLTKCDLVSKSEIGELASVIRDALPGTAIFAVTVKDLPGTGHLELKQLCEWSSDCLPEAFRYAFIKAQRVNLQDKRRRALYIVLQHIAGNFAVGLLPFLFRTTAANA